MYNKMVKYIFMRPYEIVTYLFIKPDLYKEMVNDQQGQHRYMDIGIHGQKYMDKGIWT